jgi:hypothetical protein
MTYTIFKSILIKPLSKNVFPVAIFAITIFNDSDLERAGKAADKIVETPQKRCSVVRVLSLARAAVPLDVGQLAGSVSAGSALRSGRRRAAARARHHGV